METGVLSALAKRRRVIAVDLRGHGKSGKPHDPKAYEEAVHLDVMNLMDHAAAWSDAWRSPIRNG